MANKKARQMTQATVKSHQPLLFFALKGGWLGKIMVDIPHPPKTDFEKKLKVQTHGLDICSLYKIFVLSFRRFWAKKRRHSKEKRRRMERASSVAVIRVFSVERRSESTNRYYILDNKPSSIQHLLFFFVFFCFFFIREK